ncbi:hypothetical protein ACRAWG_27560 [Methylobacterium sp. P31]
MAGDRIRVSVYEKLSLEDDKWSERRRQSRPDETYALRSEMSGESVVQADETIEDHPARAVRDRSRADPYPPDLGLRLMPAPNSTQLSLRYLTRAGCAK